MLLLLLLLGRLSDLCLHTCILHTWLRVGWFSSLFCFLTPLKGLATETTTTGTMDNHQYNRIILSINLCCKEQA
ncbi:uncharacterized protein BO87DRAFT_180623 [Aspergillus neoniger CBS 115656]|uniref:Uncharacterized protein n=1 Tax=Aspergillus neoniger (strain CBS 115656) TaxID=1448310 RepID=A0A318Y5H5_ASPNB|nr:hypothetical protein BO87DRAFT_180623 [Aspergillus neoniger CBS 115656]PYH29511.1 hypothetical protein BO87DRAFT_180623 [Aspergillus neoniger CBS 115656]